MSVIPLPRSRRPLLMSALALGQVVGWGTTYYLPSIIGPSLDRDLGFSPSVVYAGVTIMLVIGGLTSPLAGRAFDRFGAGRFLPLAPLCIGLGHLLFAAFPTPATWYGAWALFGLAMGLGLTLAATTFLTQISGAAARQDIGMLSLITGLTPSLFWPLSAALDTHYGWRTTLIVHGVIELALILPLQVWIALCWPDLTRITPKHATPPPDIDTAVPAPKEPNPTLYWAMVIAFTAQGFVSWGLPLHLIAVFESIGLESGAAVRVAAASGIAAALARMIEILAGRKASPLTSASLSFALLVPMLALILSPLDPVVGCWVFIIGWSAANGILATARVTLPLYLFGSAGYGTLMGRINLPQILTFAASPAIFAVSIELGGTRMALWLAIGVTVASVASMVVMVRAAPPRSQPTPVAGPE